MNIKTFFEDILRGAAKPVVYVVHAAENLPKVITLVDDARTDATSVIPQTATLVGDVEAIVVTGGKDAAAFLAASKVVWGALAPALASGGANIAVDIAAVTEALEQIRPLLGDSKDFSNIIPLFQKLFTDYGVFQASLKVELQQLETDAKAIG